MGSLVIESPQCGPAVTPEPTIEVTPPVDNSVLVGSVSCEEDGSIIFVITNTGDEPMQLYAVYAPVHHAPGRVHATAQDAAADEQAGTDEPPAWSVQPPQHGSDQHA